MIITEPAPAKINLALHVRRRRADGYHDLETLFAFCADGDIISVESADEDDFKITGPFAAALTNAVDHPRPSGVARPPPSPVGRGRGPAGAAGGKGEGDIPRNNLVLSAARAFTTRFAPQTRHAIVLDKHLPVASGIGGGSADAAATLRALARLHDIALEDPALAEIAASLGADVPACLLGRTAFGSGRGDSLTPLAPLGDIPALLVNPCVAVRTAAVFAAWDGEDRGPLDRADWRAARNDLEPPARAIAPIIGDVLVWLAAREGVTAARMSGSGATCFALFDSTDARDRATIAVPAEWWRLATSLT